MHAGLSRKVRLSKRSLGVLLAIVLLGCQSAPQAALESAVPAATGVGTRASIALATSAGLLGLDETGQFLGWIVTLPKGAFPSSPALHPSGKQIVFALAQTLEGIGFGSDIYSVNLDGTDLRALITRESADVFYASPSFDTSGALYVHRRAAKKDASNPSVYLETDDRIVRLDLQTGEVRTVVSDGTEPVVQPDGKTLVYIRVDRGQQAGLYTVSTDGKNPQPLLKTGDSFWFLQAPRVSPDGRQVAWSSAGRRTSRRDAAPDGYGGKLAHLDIPSQLYVAPVDGSSLRSIATTMDDVTPAWSPDGTKIAYVAIGTFFVVSVGDGAVITQSRAAGITYGDPVFLR